MKSSSVSAFFNRRRRLYEQKNNHCDERLKSNG